MLIWADRPTQLRDTWFGFLAVVLIVLTSMSLSERPFLYDIMGSSLKISFSNGCCCIKCHFLVRISLRFRTACCNSILARCRLCDFPVLSRSSSYIVFGPFAPY